MEGGTSTSGVWADAGEGFGGLCLNLDGGALWILPIPWKILPPKRVAADPTGTNEECSQVGLWSKQKTSEDRLICLISHLDGFCQVLESSPPFGRKKFQHDTFLRGHGCWYSKLF